MMTPREMAPFALHFTPDESDDANDEWGANCGPHSIAAATGRNLSGVRMFLPAFRGFMSPTEMTKALGLMASHACAPVAKFTSRLKTKTLCNGINRIQWEGKWLNPGVPTRVAYLHTHYVAHFDGWVLCTAQISWLWISLEEWTRLTELPWHVTHHWEIQNKPIAP